MYHIVETAFASVVQYGILLLEIVGAGIILISSVRALDALLRHRGNSKLMLADGIATALSFLLGSEVLKTIVAPDWQELGMTAAILLMRAGMSVLLNWEKKNEEAEEE